MPDADHREHRKFCSVRFAAVVAALVVCLGMVSCRKDFADGADGGSMAGTTIEEVLKENAGRMMAVPGVVGTAISQCDGKPCIRVLVVKKTPELMQKIPSVLEGYPVVVEETGPIRPLDRG
ncbi:MAG: hypothetical protein ACREQP_07240 [Candidatus Binatia bacterium]